ncbi:MAG: hypothetical protein AAGK04_04645 [Planctomycetota bacterium]
MRSLMMLLGVYLGLGVLFGLVFVMLGAGRLDPHARRAPLVFRLLILPGSAALWPLLARRWARAASEAAEAESNTRSTEAAP